MVGPEVVHYYDIPWMESRDQNIVQISQEFISCCSALKGRKGHFHPGKPDEMPGLFSKTRSIVLFAPVPHCLDRPPHRFYSNWQFQFLYDFCQRDIRLGVYRFRYFF